MTNNKIEYTVVINGIPQHLESLTKLEQAISRLETGINRTNTVFQTFSNSAKTNSNALSQEEKAEKKLIATIDKVVKSRTKALKARQEEENTAREAEQTRMREIEVNKEAEESIKEMGLRLEELRERYQSLTQSERENAETGGALLLQIKALDTEYSALSAGSDNFEASVVRMHASIDGFISTTDGMLKLLQNGTELLSLFGLENQKSAQWMEELQKVMAIVAAAQNLNNTLLKEGGVLTGIHAIQLKAKMAAEAASTKGTVAATAAQKIFNVVASANPYLLLATALIAVGGALFAFAGSTDKAAKKQQEFNDLQKDHLEILEDSISKENDASKARIEPLEREIKILEAKGGKQKEISALENQIAQEKRRNLDENRKKAAKEIEDLEKNKVKIEELKVKLKELEDQKAKGKGKKKKIDSEIDLLQQEIDNLNTSVEIAVKLNVEADQLETDEALRAIKNLKIKEQQAKTELDILKQTEEARLKLLEEGHERASKEIELNYERQITAIKQRLQKENDLTVNARKALNEQILILEKLKEKELSALQEEQMKKTRDLKREVEDGEISLIKDDTKRRRAEINNRYEREIEDYEKRLEKEEGLTEEQQDSIKALMEHSRKVRDRELLKLESEDLKKRTDLQMEGLEQMLAGYQEKREKALVRDEKGLQLIDIEATRTNLEESNGILDGYIAGLQLYQANLKTTHEKSLDTLEEGTPEYEKALMDYENANLEIGKKITEARAEQDKNAEESANLLVVYLQGLFGSINEFAESAMQAATAVFDVWNAGLEMQLESLNEQLESVNERYEEAQKQREEAVANVEELESQMQNATGETAEALKLQLADSLAARHEAEREEQRILREKEKMEAEIAKREKQLQRNELLTNIGQGIANTALAVTNALGTGGIVLAAIVGAMGLAQVAIMTHQLTKLAEGGEIVGPSHANGGVPIPGTNYEVEGGEFVINKRSYGANKELVKMINNTPHSIMASDLMGIFPSMSAPMVATDVVDSSENRLLQAIGAIEFKPTVAVTDIIDTTNEVVNVRELSNY